MMETDAAGFLEENVIVKKVDKGSTLKFCDHDSHSAKNFNSYDVDNYKMNHKNRGIALVINMHEFKNDLFKTREGSEVDVTNLEEVLGEKCLGFDVRPLKNLTRAQIADELDKVAQMDHKDNDCLVVVVMSHGRSNEMIAASDGVIELREIWNIFRGNESLMGKPKLFFIQACRGIKVAKGVDMIVADAQSTTISIPDFADNLIMYSTEDETISLRETDNGTWFIQELCQQLKNNVTSDLLSILTIVSRKVALKNGMVEINDEIVPAKQIPIVMSSLTKKIYFRGAKLSFDGDNSFELPNVKKTKPGETKLIRKVLPFAAFAVLGLIFFMKK